MLRHLGFPDRIVDGLEAGDPLSALHDAITELPKPLLPAWAGSPTRGGALVAIVGSWSASAPAARALLHEVGERPDALVAIGAAPGTDLDATRTVRSHHAAAELVARERREHDVVVAVLEPGPGRESADRTAASLSRLEPQGVLVTVDLTADLEGTRRVLDALRDSGLPVDGLIASGASRATRPALVLQLGLPVLWLDGSFATHGAWLGTCVDRLDAGW
jgi:hypothetical protein